MNATIQPVFVEFPKIPRWKRELVVTEKIDGTNAQVFIVEGAGLGNGGDRLIARVGDLLLYAGSRNRYITPDQDNFGFAAFVKANAEELAKMGPGIHFGEWWGAGIQRRYGLTEKRFWLFHVDRWGTHNPNTPACCGVVPILYRGEDLRQVDAALEDLATNGSKAAPGFMKPEGIVIYHTALRGFFKCTVEKDEAPKSQVARMKEQGR